MKAYYVSDRNGYADYAIIVFAENRGKAIAAALGTEEFPYGDWTFPELRAIRKPQLDKYYRGSCRMDWCDDTDRIALVKEGWYCDDDSFDPTYCELCCAKEYCDKYLEWLEECKEEEDE